MPIFEYVCQNCQHRFEKIVTGATKPVCPECAGAALEKQLSVFAAAVKGSAKNLPNFAASPAPCGSCGDPRGPGSCAMN